MAFPDSAVHGRYPHPVPYSTLSAVDAWPEYFQPQLLASVAAPGSRTDPQVEAALTDVGCPDSAQSTTYWDDYGFELPGLPSHTAVNLASLAIVPPSLASFDFPYPSCLAPRDTAAAYLSTTAPRTAYNPTQQQRDGTMWSRGTALAFGDPGRAITSAANPNHAAVPVNPSAERSDQRCRPTIGVSSYSTQQALLPLAEDLSRIPGSTTAYESQDNMVVPPFFYHPPVAVSRPAPYRIDPELPVPSEPLSLSEGSSCPDGVASSSNVSPSAWIVNSRVPTSADMGQTESALAMSDLPLPPRTVVAEVYRLDVADVPSLPSGEPPDESPASSDVEDVSPQPPSNRRRVESGAPVGPPLTTSPPGATAKTAGPGKPKRKTHICAACNKSFDRPSTLKKHSVIHTSARDYKCNLCGRLFNVQSNANRHITRCRSRPSGSPSSRSAMSKRSAKGTFTAAKPASPSSTQPGPSSLGGTHGDDAAVENIPVSPLGASVGKKRVRSETNVQPWIPASLAGFDLSGAHCKPADMPLQPVMPHKEKITDISEITDRLSGLRIKHEPDGAYYIHEERDSFAKDVHPTPYHPRGWNGRLPGPKAHSAEKEVVVMNRNMQTQRKYRL